MSFSLSPEVLSIVRNARDRNRTWSQPGAFHGFRVEVTHTEDGRLATIEMGGDPATLCEDGVNLLADAMHFAVENPEKAQAVIAYLRSVSRHDLAANTRT